jgi:glutamine synthetase
MQRVLALLESGKSVNISITKASFGLLQTDSTIPGVTAAGMYNAVPDWSSLRAGPAPGHASVFCELKEPDGTDAALCPRTILRHIVENSSKEDLTFFLGFELEFVILERNPDRNNPEKYLTMRNDGHAWCMQRVLADAGREGSFNTTVDEILDALNASGIMIEQFHPESALGQYELVLPPLPPLEACDSLLQARAIVESVAARHNFRMTLHPKPFATNCGSATHMHLSLSSPFGNHPAKYRPFYAGILRHFPALTAFTLSNPTSYERMVDSCWAGGRWVTWGSQNKEAPLRLCESSHWEFKPLDGIANPYFAAAAILAAGTLGAVNAEHMVWGDCQGDPALLSDTEKRELGITTMLPKDLPEALAALENDHNLADLLGLEFVERYIAIKKGEIALLGPMSPEERRQWVMERY